MTKQQKTQVIEALENGWNDRIFIHYKELIDSNAVRPQDDYNWGKMVDELKSKVKFSVSVDLKDLGTGSDCVGCK